MLSFATPRIVNDGNNDRGGSSPFSALDLRLPTTEQNNGIKLEYLKIWSYKIGGGKGRRKARRITSLLSSLFCSASTALGEGGKIFYRWTRNLPTSLSYFRHEINISPARCIRVDAPRILLSLSQDRDNARVEKYEDTPRWNERNPRRGRNIWKERESRKGRFRSIYPRARSSSSSSSYARWRRVYLAG